MGLMCVSLVDECEGSAIHRAPSPETRSLLIKLFLYAHSLPSRDDAVSFLSFAMLCFWGNVVDVAHHFFL